MLLLEKHLSERENVWNNKINKTTHDDFTPRVALRVNKFIGSRP